MNLFDGMTGAAPPPTAEPEAQAPGCEMVLRPYQGQAVENVYQHWIGYRDEQGDAVPPVQSVLIVLPTGTGKTVVFSEIIRRRPPGRAMVIAHREELIFQAKTTIEHVTGAIADIEMGNSYAGSSDIVIATVQTLSRGRHQWFKPEEFSVLVIDECFPSTTIVDGRSIAKVRTGDQVYSVNHDTGQLQTRLVLRTFKRAADKLVRVSLSSGQRIICTPNHPIFTLRGYVQACRLLSTDMVITTTGLERLKHEEADLCYLRNGLYSSVVESGHDALLQEGVRPGGDFSQTPASGHPLFDLRTGRYIGRAPLGEPKEEDGFVRVSGVQIRALTPHHREHLCQTRRRDYAIPKNQRDAQTGSEGAGFDQAAGDGMEADCANGQRTDDPTAANHCLCLGLGDGGCNTDIEAQGFRLSDVLQGGRWQRRFESRYRGGRPQPQGLCQASGGPQERNTADFPWVDGIEILERGSNGTFGGLCPDGFVYNLEVEGNNNYFADRILVHNCHHATADTYQLVHEYFKGNPKLKVLGVTATPDRADEEALGKVFQSVAFDYELPDAIRDGWLVPIMARSILVEGLDYSHIRTTAGDLNGADLEAVMIAEQPLQEMAQAVVELGMGLAPQTLAPLLAMPDDEFAREMASRVAATRLRKTLAFTATIAHAERLCEVLNRWVPDCARFVCGKTPTEERRRLFLDFKDGVFNVLCNVGVATEGFDEPTIEVIVLGRPTKSRALFSQMIGRGTRALPGVVDGPLTPELRRAAIAASAKTCIEIIDFTANTGRHRLVSAADILGGNYTDEVIERAEKKAADANGQPVDVAESLEEALREIEEEKKRAAAERAKLKARSDYKIGETFDPLALLGVNKYRERGWERGREPSPKMKAWVEKMGLWKDGMSFATARQICQGAAKRIQSGVCSVKQAKILVRAGFSANTSFKDAHTIIDVLAANRWQWPKDRPRPTQTEGPTA